MRCVQAASRIRLYCGQHGNGRKRDMTDSLRDDNIWVICATKAFGLGIDIPDISKVIVLGAPRKCTDFYQWMGRAGRDGEFAVCILAFRRREASGMDKTMHDICACGEYTVGCIWEKLRVTFSPLFAKVERVDPYLCCSFCYNSSTPPSFTDEKRVARKLEMEFSGVTLLAQRRPADRIPGDTPGAKRTRARRLDTTTSAMDVDENDST